MAGEEGKVAVNELRDKLNFGRKTDSAINGIF